MFRSIGRIVMIVAALSFSAGAAMAQNAPCNFDPATLQFAGTPRDQARCLLRPNAIGGKLGEQLAKLPEPLERLIGAKTAIKADRLRKYLKESALTEEMVGGDLDAALSDATLPDGSTVPALYFIIHDTSTPNLLDAAFPDDLDTNGKARVNDLTVWTRAPVAHVFVNRLGDSLTVTPFAEPVRKGWGTKFARDFLKAPGKGLQLHIELVQPRRRDPSSPNANNDRLAPVPGFSDAQYQRLALLYTVASVRRGSWLVPAYHSAIDAGIMDAHDDPQNFELAKFADALRSLLRILK